MEELSFKFDFVLLHFHFSPHMRLVAMASAAGQAEGKLPQTGDQSRSVSPLGLTFLIRVKGVWID